MAFCSSSWNDPKTPKKVKKFLDRNLRLTWWTCLTWPLISSKSRQYITILPWSSPSYFKTQIVIWYANYFPYSVQSILSEIHWSICWPFFSGPFVHIWQWQLFSDWINVSLYIFQSAWFTHCEWSGHGVYSNVFRSSWRRKYWHAMWILADGYMGSMFLAPSRKVSHESMALVENRWKVVCTVLYLACSCGVFIVRLVQKF